MIAIKAHYTHVVKSLIRMFEAGQLSNVITIYVEPDYGFVAQVKYRNLSVRYIHGASVDVNANGASFIATDKAHAKRFMTALGYRTPIGKAFVVPRRMDELKSYYESYGIEETSTFSTIPDYVTNTIGFPCFIKPNNGYRGVDVYQCWDLSDVNAVLTTMSERCYDLIIVEAAASMPEYRVVIFEGRFIACYSKRPLSITGDGTSTIEQLLLVLVDEMARIGRKVDLEQLKPQIQHRLSKNNLDLATVLGSEMPFQLVDMANLSTGGSTEDFTHLLHPQWQALCIQLSRDMNLGLVGIDFMCADITRPEADYTIIEINAAPALNNYASLGALQAQRVEALYLEIFNTPTS
ncbi:MAG: hypothetical protein IPO91_18780 [Chloroflexi bacterium]|nr:hypothetical protein [Chloroflexota bacterium]